MEERKSSIPGFFEGLWAGAFAGVGLDRLLKEGIRSVSGWVCIGIALLCFVVGKKYEWIVRHFHISKEFVQSLEKIASDARYWVFGLWMLWFYFAVGGILNHIATVRSVGVLSKSVLAMENDIEVYVLPRHLRQKQTAMIADYLNHFDSHDFKMIVKENDSEASDYASDINVALQKGGWKIVGIDYKNVPDGISLSLESTPERSAQGNQPRNPNPEMLIEQAFGQYGVRIDSSGGGGLSDYKGEDILTISVGARHRNTPPDVTLPQ